MNKLIIGDIHTKAAQLLPKINEIISTNNIDEVYFLGDYSDEWGVSNADRLKDLQVLIDWNNNSSTKNTFLCGNHDLAYIAPHYCCSGHSRGMEYTLSKLLAKELNVQMAVLVNGYLLTHAGINSDWLAVLNNYVDMTGTIDDTLINIVTFLNQELNKVKELVNEMGPVYNVYNSNEINFIAACSSVRGGFNKFSGPLWCDKKELIDRPAINFKQIVGHTPVETCTKVSFEDLTEDTALWFCDTHSLTPNFENIGDNSMLLLNNEEIIKVGDDINE